jgi:hypothetical protein
MTETAIQAKGHQKPREKALLPYAFSLLQDLQQSILEIHNLCAKAIQRGYTPNLLPIHQR